MINELTANQIEDAIARALSEQCVGVVPGLIKLLALKDPHRARVVYDTIELGIAISRMKQDRQDHD